MSVGELLFDKLPGTDADADEASAWQVGEHSGLPHNMLGLSGLTALARAGKSESLMNQRYAVWKFSNCRLRHCGVCVTCA